MLVRALYRLAFFLVFVMTSFLPASAELGDDGLHKQDWFYLSFLELNEDLKTAGVEGKHLMVIFEQAGCPYCKELHEVNFKDQEIVDLIKKKFVVVQLDLWGSREATDLLGNVMEERDLARQWLVNYTPTTVFLSSDKHSGSNEVFRTPGYLKKFHYASALEFVSSKAYQKLDFQRYLQGKIQRLREQGQEIKIW
mgnify:FL=1